MGSPIETWDGAGVVFTGADSPFVTGLILVLAVVATAVPVIEVAIKESHLYKRYLG